MPRLVVTCYTMFVWERPALFSKETEEWISGRDEVCGGEIRSGGRETVVGYIVQEKSKFFFLNRRKVG